MPSRAEDIDVPAKHNYFATVEAVKQIFQTNKQVYVQYKHADPLSGEKFEHDMDSLSMGIVKVHNQNTFKVQKLKLFDQFEAHKLDDFKQNITALLDDLLKALYPCPIALQCTYAPEKKVQSSRSKVTDVVDSVAHDQVSFVFFSI